MLFAANLSFLLTFLQEYAENWRKIVAKNFGSSVFNRTFATESLSLIRDRNMSRPIKETPILYGKAARKFEEEMQRVENMTREERMANRKK